MTKRRDFIRQSVLGSAGIAIGGMGFTAQSYGSIIGSNDRQVNMCMWRSHAVTIYLKAGR
jgi:hypothetical protein